MFTRDNPYPYEGGQRFKNIQWNYEKMRRVVLERGYDHVWCVESDTIPPLDAVERLFEAEAPVVSGLYALRHGDPIPNVQRWSETLNGIGGAMSWEEVGKGGTVRTSGGSMGCLLIERSVLEGFTFVRDNNKAPDVPFMEYCFHLGIRQMARLDVICLHKKPNGEVLDPRTYIN